MQLLLNIQHVINESPEKNAFIINTVKYSYLDFAKSISKIRQVIGINTNDEEKIIGLVANDDLETYATIIALWLEGKAYVPLDPASPIDRNKNIIKQTVISTVIDSTPTASIDEVKTIASKTLPDCTLDLTPKDISDDQLVYILFTSGTTGQPKGVSITRANVAEFVSAFDALGLAINDEDRCLQMFDLTFDLSVMSYFIPLLKGACIFTIPKDAIKFSYIYELLEEQRITVALMVPSILHYLRPYFKEIYLPEMRYNLFCGEALPNDITSEWSNCIPNAKLLNVYGPTEDTIFCTYFNYHSSANNKAYNGLVAIGQAMKGTFTIIVDENNQVLPFNQVGQLCLGGVQLTPGYWNNPEKNKDSFFISNYKNKPERFYKTGDLCKMDNEGDILYIGRLDYQIKVQGFRVELSEIEYHVKVFLKKINAVATAYTDAIGNTEIGLIIEAEKFETAPLTNYLKTKLPLYMIPRIILFSGSFPLNSNGKTDRNKLALLLKK